MKLKVGDKVRVMVGKDKGKEGKITRVFAKENKVVVEGVNIAKRHLKPDNSNQTGGIVEREAKLHASNVMIIDKKTNKPTRIYHEVNEKTNKKVRVGKSHEKLD